MEDLCPFNTIKLLALHKEFQAIAVYVSFYNIALQDGASLKRSDDLIVTRVQQNSVMLSCNC
jgi:hypothetical protein